MVEKGAGRAVVGRDLHFYPLVPVSPMVTQEQVLATPKINVQHFVEIITSPTFPEQESKEWACFAYVFVIFGIKYVIMRNREPFDLTLPLNIWNAILALFSIMGTIMLFPEFIGTIQNNGLQASYCKVYGFTKGSNGFWGWLFIVSKLFELADTVFLVLRKKPLMFLHWYHHILTLIYAFYSYPHTPGFNRWGIFMNFLVHAFMYSYVHNVASNPSIRTQCFDTRTPWNTDLCKEGMFLTFVSLQVDCDFDDNIFKLALFMDVSYLILFINFFCKAYVFGGDLFLSSLNTQCLLKLEAKYLHIGCADIALRGTVIINRVMCYTNAFSKLDKLAGHFKSYLLFAVSFLRHVSVSSSSERISILLQDWRVINSIKEAPQPQVALIIWKCKCYGATRVSANKKDLDKQTDITNLFWGSHKDSCWNVVIIALFQNSLAARKIAFIPENLYE
ncbi:Elongation of very long chain fatty acids protein [Dirofilaria immitis]|nr:Elongation of very long chain fatty acids protein [Dirofilaria immitis]